MFVGAPDHSEGHYLVANTDINAGDVVLSDYPLGIIHQPPLIIMIL